MGRNHKYRYTWYNSADWKLTLWCHPAYDGGSTMETVVIDLPWECLNDPGIFSELSASFENAIPVGMVDTEVMTIRFNLTALEEAAFWGYDYATDIEQMFDYIVNPVYPNGGELNYLGVSGRVYDTRNFWKLTVEGGPFKAPFTLFEGMQEEQSEDELIVSEAGTLSIVVRIRNFWRVALEMLTGADVYDRFYATGALLTPTLTTDRAFEIIYNNAGREYSRDTRYPSRYSLKEGGTRHSLEEFYDWFKVSDLWKEIGRLCANVYTDHRREGATSADFASPDSHTEGCPFDLVTPYRQTYTATGTKGAEYTNSHDGGTWPDWSKVLFLGRAFFKHPKGATSTEVESGGFLSAHATFGIQKLASLWDFVKQATEQSLAKCVPMWINSDVRLLFYYPFETYHQELSLRSENAFSIARSSIQDIREKDAGDRFAKLRSGLIGTVEAGMQEGTGDDEKTITYREFGHEQRDGFNIPFAMHNLPKLGNANDDTNPWADKPGKLSDGSADDLRCQNKHSWEGGLYYEYQSSTAGVGSYTSTAGGSRSIVVRLHENVGLNLGNGHTETDTTTVARSTETNWDFFKEDIRNAMKEMQATTCWPLFAAKAYAKYFGSKYQFSIELNVPGEQALPEYIGEWFDIYDDENPTAKGLRAWYDTQKVADYPEKFCLIDTKLDFAESGRAVATFFASPYAE